MLSEQLTSSGITSNQDWADILGIENSSIEILNVFKSNKEQIKDISDNLPPQSPPILPNLRFSYLSLAFSDNILILESQLKRIIKIPSQYQGFTLVSSGYNQRYEQEFEVVPETYAQVLISLDIVH